MAQTVVKDIDQYFQWMCQFCGSRFIEKKESPTLLKK